MRFRDKLRLIMSMALLIPAASSAQQSQEVEQFYFADTVTVEGLRHLRIPTLSAIATKSILPLHQTPASVGVVTRQLFSSQSGMVLSDALKNVSGVNVQNGTGTHDFFLIRGFDSLDGGLVLTDGAVEPEVSFYNLYNIERVEALKGPSAFLYGSNPLSGAVNLTRKQPVFGQFASFSGSYGEFNTFSGMFDAGFQTSENLAVRVNGLWQDSENYRDRMDKSTYAVNPAATWKIDDKSSLTANFEYVRSNAEPDAGLPLIQAIPGFIPEPLLPDVPLTRSYQTPLDDSEQDLFRLRLDYQRRVNKSLTVRNKFFLTQLDWLSTGSLLNGAFPDPSRPGEFSVIRTLNSLDDSQKFLGNQFEALLEVKTGAVTHNLVAGVEARRFTDDFKLDLAPFSPPSEFNPTGTNGQLVIDLNNPQEFASDRSQLTFLPFASGDARTLTVAPYLLDQVSFGEQVQFFLGGRFDVIDYENDRADLNFQTFQSEPSADSRNYEEFSPMAGLVVSPFADLSLYANFGRSFRAPSTLTKGTPEPEESTQFEAGAKLQALNGKLTSTLAIYNLEKENTGVQNDDGVTLSLSDQRSRGLEFEVAVQPTSSVHSFVNYAYTDAEFTNFFEFDREGNPISRTGNRPAFTPRSILNFWATKTFSNIGVGAGFRYVGKQFIDETEGFEIDDHLTVDATLFYTYRDIRWSLNVKNITDKEYLRRGGFGSSSVTPGNPRAIYGSVSLTL